jgi:hypothetical protein
MASKMFSQTFTVGSTCCNYHLVNVTFTSVPINISGNNYTNTYTIDVDGDLGYDIKIVSEGCFCMPYQTSESFYIFSPNQCQFVFAANTQTSCYYSSLINNNVFGSAINGSLNWSVCPTTYTYGGPSDLVSGSYWEPSYSYNCGTAVTDSFFVCFRKPLPNTDTIYGWFRIGNAKPGKVFDYAYTCSANTESFCTTGISEISNSKNRFSIYPNPSNTNFMIEAAISEKLTLELSDEVGKLLLSQNFMGKTNIETSNLPNGIYFVKVIGEQKQTISAMKIIVQH